MGEGSTTTTDVTSQYECKMLFMTSILQYVQQKMCIL